MVLSVRRQRRRFWRPSCWVTRRAGPHPSSDPRKSSGSCSAGN